MKSPYSFPARSRAAMIDAITAIGNRRSYDYRSWPFCWDVKLHFNLPHTAAELNGNHYDGDTFNPAWDDEWQAEMEKEWFFYNLIEDMRRPYVEGEYSTYPGDDQGELKFGFYGRSGGWLVLEEAYGRKMRDLDLDELADKDEWPMDDLRKLYRALVCINQDVTGKAVEREALHQIGFQRTQWEDERQQEEAAKNAAIVQDYYDARPDLAPAY